MEDTYMAAMAKRPMTLDLFATLDIVDDDVSAVVDAYLADPAAATRDYEISQQFQSAQLAAHGNL
ncbi:MAG: hypothetical protein MIL41_16730, partial [Hyphomicrobiales bacterium]